MWDRDPMERLAAGPDADAGEPVSEWDPYPEGRIESDPPEEPPEPDPPGPAPEPGPARQAPAQSVYLNEQGAQALLAYADQFGIEQRHLVEHIGATYGAEKLTELTTAQYRDVRLWIQDQAAAVPGRA